MEDDDDEADGRHADNGIAAAVDVTGARTSSTCASFEMTRPALARLPSFELSMMQFSSVHVPPMHVVAVS